MDRPIYFGRARNRFIEKGCWIKPFGDVIYLTPPFVIEEPDLSCLTRAINEVLNGR
jgi:adenosylmethionine-8-amino-7-oxononanoate aminotransferase